MTMETVRCKSVEGIAIPPFQALVTMGKCSFHAPEMTCASGLKTDQELFNLALYVSKLKSELTPFAQKSLVREGVSTQQNTKNLSDKNDFMDDEAKWKPCITLDSLTAMQLHHWTRFHDLKNLLTYSAIEYEWLQFK